jgi:hypothetical protein
MRINVDVVAPDVPRSSWLRKEAVVFDNSPNCRSDKRRSLQKNRRRRARISKSLEGVAPSESGSSCDTCFPRLVDELYAQNSRY